MAKTTTATGLVQTTIPNIDLALVAVGVDFYPQSTIPPLSCAANDAEATYALIASRRLKTQAALLVNEEATVDGIRNAVVSAARKIHENGTLLLTFSGHGVPINTGDQWEAAFLTHEFRSFNDIFFGRTQDGLHGAFTLQDVKRWLNEAGDERGSVKPTNIVVLMDSCGAGASIVHDATGNADVDGKTAVARRFESKEDVEFLEHVGAIHADQVSLDSSRVDWPNGSAVLAVSAATRGGAAYEIPDIGHGVLSLLVLEWFSKVFLAKPDGVTDLGRELLDYINQEIARLKSSAGPEGLDLQRPAKATQDDVAIDNTDCLVRSPVASSLLSIGRSMPVPKRTGDPAVFEENVSRIAQAFTRQIDNPGDANSVVEIPRFVGTRALLQTAAARVADQVGPNRPTLFLGLGRIRRIVPLIGSLEAAFESLPGQQANVAAGSPVVAECLPSLIDNYVERLKENHACVIAPFRRRECDDLMIRFLKRCTFEPNIRLVLALYANEPVPEWATVAHFHRIELRLPPRAPLEERMRQLDIGDDLGGVPDEFFNATVLHWLETLWEREPNKHKWRTSFFNHAYPVVESGNGTRAVLNVIKALLLVLDDESPNLLCLLKAMGAISLPRCERLTRHIWNQLEEENLVVNTDDGGIDGVLLTMLRHRVISESEPRTGGQQPCPRHYFVHSLVRTAAVEHERNLRQRNPARKAVDWEGIAGKAIRDLLRDPSFDEWWPRSVLAHEAIRHLMAASLFKDACQVLLDNWRELVDSGYHEPMLQWCRALYAEIAPATLDDKDTLESLRLLIPMLLRQQTLHRHRQEWEGMRELHSEIVHRTSRFRPQVEDSDPEPVPEMFDAGLERCYWQSRHNEGNFHFVHKKFDDAKNEYQECTIWAAKAGIPNLELSSLIRLAHCCVLEWEFSLAEEQMDEIEERIAQLDREDLAAAARHRRHLRSVKIEEAGLKEDHERLHKLAMEGWTESLKNYATEGGRERFDLAISNIQMGWASMVRGEFLRAWRHALQARRFLNDRGIAEHWWYCETERIAALAIAQMFRCLPPLREDYTPWYRQTFVHSDGPRDLFTPDVLERQGQSLEKLIRIGLYHNPWRAAELLGALGEFQIHAQRRHGNGKRRLKEALRLAGDKGHRFLEARIHESLGALNVEPGAQHHFGKCHEILRAMDVDRVTERCRRNWESSRGRRTEIRNPPNS